MHTQPLLAIARAQENLGTTINFIARADGTDFLDHAIVEYLDQAIGRLQDARQLVVTTVHREAANG